MPNADRFESTDGTLAAGRRFARLILSSAVAALTCSAAFGQTGAPATRERQAEIYARLLEAPDDPALTQEYLRVSEALQDNEAVISTLERMLIYRPGDPEVLAELGAAYFRLGSFPTARQHLTEARNRLSDGPLRARVDDYLAAIDERSSPSRFSGFGMVGVVASSNANLGVVDRTLRLGGADIVFDPNVEAQGDVGFRALGVLTHVHDLGRPNSDAWRTELGLYSVRYFDEDAGDVDTLSFATGPSLGLTEDAFGPVIRPFAAFRAARSANSPLYVEYGGGFDYGALVGERATVFAVLGAGYRDFSDEEGFDGAVVRGLAGIGYSLSPTLSFAASAIAETDRAENAFNASTDVGIRLSGSYDYDPGLEMVDGLWRLSAYVEVRGRFYDEADPGIDPGTTRRDADIRIGAAQLFRIADGFGLQLDVDWLVQESNIANYDVRNVTAGLSAVYEF